MKKLEFLIIGLFCLSFNCFSQTSVCQKAGMVVKTAQKYHYAPREINDQFSELVFDEFIKSLDPNHQFLTSEDYQELSTFKFKLDDEILNENCEFIQKVIDIFSITILKYGAFLENSKEAKLDFSLKDTLFFGDNVDFIPLTELERKWRKIIKYNVLFSYFDSVTVDQEWSSIEKKLFAAQIESFENKKKRLNYKYGDALNLVKYIESIYLNAIAFAFDPHSNYFSPEDESDFETMLSKSVLSFGIEIFKNTDGEIEIHQVLPGSVAWQTHQINEGDVILEIEKTKGQVEELSYMSIKKVRKLLSSIDIENTKFKIRKTNGKIITLKMAKESINVDENIIESFILKGKEKVGYIYIPSFYSQIFQEGMEMTAEGCANDVAKEVLKLKRENIQGLVIDLRNNGGGSMLEAIKLIGSFVNYGALCISDSRSEETPLVYKDFARGVLFDKPIVVMINESSASASEFFASALKHYNRALIVGSTSFGKSTSQIILPVDAYKYDYFALTEKKVSENGYLKVTTSQFYNVDGSSYQNIGVIPDVALPNVYDEIEIGERNYATSLKATTIDKKAYYYPLDSLPTKELSALSQKRIDTSSAYTAIKENSQFLSDYYKLQKIPLNYYDFQHFFTDGITALTDIDTDSINSSNFLVNNPSYIKGISSSDSSEIEINQYVMENIRADIYIREVYLILNDLITFVKN